MKIPDLDYSATAEAVSKNRNAIKAARAELRAMTKALDGCQAANEAMCSHPNKSARYDPGYAGGGFSHYECPDCGGQTMT